MISYAGQPSFSQKKARLAIGITSITEVIIYPDPALLIGKQ